MDFIQPPTDEEILDPARGRQKKEGNLTSGGAKHREIKDANGEDARRTHP